MSRIDRRDFFRASALGATYLATARMAAAAHDANGKLRLASIGTGGKGKEDLQRISASPRVEVVAICDVDDSKEHFGWAAEKYAKAERFNDFRRLMDKAKMFDAVSVSTPDHMHAPIALAAMALGKHVFCQKPLTHTVQEARQMREAARKHKLVTQMGNQIQSEAAYRAAVKLVHDGVIGKVKEVHSWQAGEMRWLKTDKIPEKADPAPKNLNWDLWLGVAPTRQYNNELYHPASWRAWQDFSNGQLGDFGCHILDPVFMALGLTAPTTIEADADPLGKWVWAKKSKIEYTFPGTERTAGDEIKVTWYDGPGHKPTLEGLGFPATMKLRRKRKKPGEEDKEVKFELPGGGSALIGEKGTMILPHWAMPELYPEEKFADFKMPEVGSVDHYTSWAHACLGDGKTTSNFDYAGPLTETVLLGSIAIRFPKEQIQWDAKGMECTHNADATARLKKEYRIGWKPPLGTWSGRTLDAF